VGATVFISDDQPRHSGKRNQAERGSGTTFQGCAATRADESRQVHLLCTLLALALARRGGTRVAAQRAGAQSFRPHRAPTSGASRWSGTQSTGNANGGVLPRSQP